LYSAVAGLFVLAGLSLKVEGASMGTPIPWILIALVFSGPFLYYRPVSVSNNALAPALLAGDFLLVDRFTRPAVGDLVAFVDPKDKQVALGRISASPVSGKYEVPGFGLITAGEIVGRPKIIYDSLEGDATHAPLRRWDRVFKAL
jgi:signal peptidase I